jgi:hypothetical protein
MKGNNMDKTQRYHFLLLRNPHLAEIIAGTDRHRSRCAERLLDLIASCSTTEDVQRLQSNLPHIHFLDLDMGTASQFLGAAL